MKYEIKPEYRHLFDEDVRDLKLPIERPVNEGCYIQMWNEYGLTKEALQPVTDFQKGEWLMWERKHEKILFVFNGDSTGYRLWSYIHYTSTGERKETEMGLKIENCHKPTDEELHDFLLGMVKARYKEGDRVKSIASGDCRKMSLKLENVWKSDFLNDQAIYCKTINAGAVCVMQKGKWAEKVESKKKLALYRYKLYDANFWKVTKKYYEDDEQFQLNFVNAEHFQRLTNTEFEVCT